MGKWQPDAHEREFLELIFTMTSDCLLGTGVDNVDTYISNLSMIADRLKDIAEEGPDYD